MLRGENRREQHQGRDCAVQQADHHKRASRLYHCLARFCGDKTGCLQQKAEESGADRVHYLHQKVHHSRGSGIHSRQSHGFVVSGALHQHRRLKIRAWKLGKPCRKEGDHQHCHAAPGEEVDNIAADSERAEHDDKLSDASLLDNLRKDKHESKHHDRHRLQLAVFCDISDNKLEIVDRRIHAHDELNRAGDHADIPYIGILSQHGDDLLQRNLLRFSPALRRLVDLFDKDKPQHTQNCQRNRKHQHEPAPAGRRDGNSLHQNWERNRDRRGAERADNSSERRHLDDFRTVCERADDIGLLSCAQQRGKYRKGQRIHGKDPDTLCRHTERLRAAEEQNRAAPGPNQRKFVRSRFAKPRIGIVHEISCEQIRDRVENFTAHHQRADDSDRNTQISAGIQTQISQNDRHTSQ